MPIAHNLLVILSALGPIFFMIVLGYLLRRGKFPGDAFWPGAERLTYFVLFPALLVHRLALADMGEYDIVPVAIAIVTVLLAMTLLLFLFKPLLGVSGPAFSSIYQGAIRFNTYVGLAAAGALLHQPGATFAALAMAILIPLINVLCVIVLSHAGGSMHPLGLLNALTRNPLILACLVGIALNASGVGLPLGSERVLDILARAALPVGLLAVGAGLVLHVTRSQPLELLLACGLKLLVLPAMMYGLCWIVGSGPLETAVLVLFAALPGAPSSYILARQLGGDAQLMAAIVTVETGVSILTLPVVLLLVL